MPTYKVFKRRPWKRNKAWPGGWEPYGGARKTPVAHGQTFERARQMCAEGNKNNTPGKLGQMYYEFEVES